MPKHRLKYVEEEKVKRRNFELPHVVKAIW